MLDKCRWFRPAEGCSAAVRHVGDVPEGVGTSSGLWDACCGRGDVPLVRGSRLGAVPAVVGGPVVARAVSDAPGDVPVRVSTSSCVLDARNGREDAPQGRGGIVARFRGPNGPWACRRGGWGSCLTRQSSPVRSQPAAMPTVTDTAATVDAHRHRAGTGVGGAPTRARRTRARGRRTRAARGRRTRATRGRRTRTARELPTRATLQSPTGEGGRGDGAWDDGKNGGGKARAHGTAGARGTGGVRETAGCMRRRGCGASAVGVA